MKSIVRILVALTWVLIAGTATAQSVYTIKAGDTLDVEVLEDKSLNRSVVVLPDGRFSFPLAGSILARGRTVDQISAAVADAIKSNFATPPTVYVGVRPAPPKPVVPAVQRAPVPDPVIGIYLMGEVSKGGRIEVAPGTTFLQALAQAGGLTPFAASKRIQIRRTDPYTHKSRLMTINYHALSRGAALNQDIALIEGDVILVPERRLFE
ncbi:polysaccharide biosynthesis/export family protein [Primorskyibacter sp. 2E233]|uniref:polysaccharide biosynthesis/export family protein n=1 Tax=Primorskyibacter sp. 2E233 TaxID=3413431 RepID=UPI003BF2B25F